ncbi:pentapeptide repeat-containing protein [Aliikangiella sp. IMCC44653]
MPLRFPDEPLYQLLRAEKVKEFNQQKPQGETLDFHDCDFRGLDLRGLDASHCNFSGCYFRAADLRGIDFSLATLSGASVASAQISGCLFPDKIRAEEILLSVDKGTRMRPSS